MPFAERSRPGRDRSGGLTHRTAGPHARRSPVDGETVQLMVVNKGYHEDRKEIPS